MKKKAICGLVAVLFTGFLGVATVSEAVGNREDNQMKTFEFGRRHSRHQGFRTEEQTVVERNVEADKPTKEEASERQKNWEKRMNDSHVRRENNHSSRMNDEYQNHNGRMNGFCH